MKSTHCSVLRYLKSTVTEYHRKWYWISLSSFDCIAFISLHLRIVCPCDCTFDCVCSVRCILHWPQGEGERERETVNKKWFIGGTTFEPILYSVLATTTVAHVHRRRRRVIFRFFAVAFASLISKMAGKKWLVPLGPIEQFDLPNSFDR